MQFFTSCFTCLFLAVATFRLAGDDVIIEAENGKMHSPLMEVRESTTASGQKYVLFNNTRFQKTTDELGVEPELTLSFTVAQTGHYALSVRFIAPDVGSDSFHYAIDQQPVQYWGSPIEKVWTEKLFATVRLDAGTHQVKFWTRERNFQLDNVVIRPTVIKDKSTVPRLVIEAENGVFDPARVMICPAASGSGKGVALKPEAVSNVTVPGASADIILSFNVAQTGRYELFSTASLAGTANYAHMMVAIDDQFPREKVVISPWKNINNCQEHLQKADLAAGVHQLKIFLPKGVTLDRLELLPLKLPSIPSVAANYRPPIVPPASRPRILISRQTLPEIRRNLTMGENRPFWESVQKQAEQPYSFVLPSPQSAVGMNDKLLDLAVKKAFVYLMTENRAKGVEAVKLIRDYIAMVEFGNQLDICRQIGLVIHSSSLVYDWCYDLMTAEDKEIIRKNLLRLAEDMEIGWPPFGHTIVAGHGSEAQVSRDLLSMGIAIYDEDPLPYRLCAYRLLEEMIPAHNFEYRSGRHAQGSVIYGPYRFSWDMYAAWIFYRMSGRDVFSADLKKIPYFWLYMTTPDGGIFSDGDGALSGARLSYQYNLLLTYTYANNPLLKGEFLRQDGMKYALSSAVLFLLFNNPSLKAESELTSLPLTRYFSEPLGSMVCRTGWSRDRYSADAVVEMKGAGIQFYNHQHFDAGAFQVYYRGVLAGDLGLYQFYGTPYDMNFNKRSVAHNVMLAYDPQEQFSGGCINDGGQKFLNNRLNSPCSLEEMQSGKFSNGSVTAHDFGPNQQRPLYSYMKTDLTAAYSNKITFYDRSACFLNLGMKGIPAALIIFDRINVSRPEIRLFWQLNSLEQPTSKENVITIINQQHDVGGKLTLTSLSPSSDDVAIATVGGKEAHTVFGHAFKPPYKFRQAFRTMVSSTKSVQDQRFLEVMVMSDINIPELKPQSIDGDEYQGVLLADRVVCFARTEQVLKNRQILELPSSSKEYQVLFNDLIPGAWTIKTDNGKSYRADVKEEAGNLFIVLPPGRHELIPGAVDANATGLPDYRRLEAVPAFNGAAVFAGKVMLNRQEIASVRSQGNTLLVPVEKVLAMEGVKMLKDNKQLTAIVEDKPIVFTDGSNACRMGNCVLMMSGTAVLDDGVWYLPADIVGRLINCDTRVRPENKSVWFYARHATEALIFWLESSNGNDWEKLQTIFSGESRSDYWAAHGKDVWLKILLINPQIITGVGIEWVNGNKRKAFFSLETSMDGKNWQPAFSGESSGISGDMEFYSFTPRMAQMIRFNGYGNSQNNWNSIYNMKLMVKQENSHNQ